MTKKTKKKRATRPVPKSANTLPKLLEHRGISASKLSVAVKRPKTSICALVAGERWPHDEKVVARCAAKLEITDAKFRQLWEATQEAR